METAKTSNRLHPLVAAAAISVLLASLTGVAAITGLLPSSHGKTGPTAELSSPSSTEDIAGKTGNTDAKTLAAIPDAGTPVPERTQASTDNPSVQSPTVCHSCGKIESIRAIQQPAKTSGIGIAAGAVLGGLVGNQFGAGNGRTLSTVAGAVGGGFAGNEVEKRTHTATVYQIHVRMADGHMRTFTQHTQQGWRVGDRVKVVNGALTAEG
jgi:outer membrane lipoprotein SlyB